MEAYTEPQQRKKEESERLRGERDQIKFIDLGFYMLSIFCPPVFTMPCCSLLLCVYTCICVPFLTMYTDRTICLSTILTVLFSVKTSLL